MTRVPVFLLLAGSLAAWSRQPPQQNPSSSQPSSTASPSAGPATPPTAAAPAAPAAADQPAAAAPNTPAGSPEPASSATAENEAPTATAAPPAPRFREITIPADTLFTVTLETSIASDTSQVEDPVEGRLARAVVVSRTTVLPAGSRVTGTVIDAKRSGRVKGRASVVLRFNRITAHGESYPIQTARITREADASTKSDVKKGGIGAGVGAVVGGIAGGGKGAAIGGVLGGAGTVMATRGKEVQLPSGTTLTARFTSPLAVRVAVSEGAVDRRRSPQP